MGLTIVPITQKEAAAYVQAHHRHHRPPVGSVYQLAVVSDDAPDVIVGVAMVGRPVARHLDNGWTLEVNRVATDGTRNACSALYGAAWKVARGLGYRRLVTYTLPEEGGASLRGAGLRCVGETGGGSWSSAARPRVDLHPTQVKMRWQYELDPAG